MSPPRETTGRHRLAVAAPVADTGSTSPAKFAKQALGQWRLVAALVALVIAAVGVRFGVEANADAIVELKAQAATDHERVESVRTTEASLTTAVDALTRAVDRLNDRIDRLSDRPAPREASYQPPPRP